MQCIPPHLKRVATLPCEMFNSENSLLISEIHLIISLHFSFAKKTANRDLKNDSTLCVAVRPLLSSNFRSISNFVPSHHAHRVEFFVPFPTVKSASQSVKNSLRY